jgi:hypothetical protein
MRSALLIAAACVVCLSQPSVAGYTISIQFSKPNASSDAFLHDRNACLRSAGRSNWHTSFGGGGTWGAAAIPGRVTYNLSSFGRCMVARGYTLDPNGFRAVTFRHLRDGTYRLLNT